jgi:hypothetical protein
MCCCLCRFVPGRTDSAEADSSGLLPAPEESLESILGAFKRAGLGSLDAVANLASHTTACFTAGCLDSTPSAQVLLQNGLVTH